jgi:hypothetical protein
VNIQLNDCVLPSHENAEQLVGKYLSHCKPVRSTKEANSPETTRKLWKVSKEWMKGLSGSKAQSTTTNTTECA